MRLHLASMVVCACSSTPVKGVCCTDTADCAEIALDEPRPCDVGQACIDHFCVVPDCATNGCMASTPVCTIETGQCVGCRDSADCTNFGAADVCEPASGACVECVGATDCEVGRPVCDAGSCRQCKLDAECASGACGDDGACITEEAIVYLSPTGTDAGLCTRAAPCVGWTFAFSKTSTSRSHIVMATGEYQEFLGPNTTTSAASVTIHGGGSTMVEASAEGFLTLGIPVSIRDLIMRTGGTSISTSRALTLDRVRIVSTMGAPVISTNSILTIRDSEIEAVPGANPVIEAGTGANLTIDRVAIRGGRHAISDLSNAGVNVKLTNVLAHGASHVALDLSMAAGTIEFTTITGSGSSTTAGTRLLLCSPFLSVASSIVWDGTGSFPQRPPLTGSCTLANVIAGPLSVAGATSIDPVFVDPAARDFHIAPNSPAKDAVDVGPASDFEGDPRPRGSRFDIGADETP